MQGTSHSSPPAAGSRALQEEVSEALEELEDAGEELEVLGEELEVVVVAEVVGETLPPPTTAAAKKRKQKENVAPDAPAGKRAKNAPPKQFDNAANVKAATTKKPSAVERLKERDRELLEARARIAELEAELAETKKKLKNALKKKEEPLKLIPKPEGQAVVDHSIQKEMQLDNDKGTYNAVVAAVRKTFTESKVPVKARINEYTVSELNLIFTNDERTSSDGDWATRDLLKQHFKNRKSATATAAKALQGKQEQEKEKEKEKEQEEQEEEAEQEEAGDEDDDEE
ncbi:hypothetical protein CALCODRAFT_488038 [Calocera cornea HHB12733]|uniref:Uncharacterized protein n=1 Tax=Calocera cornea HHB12733 TaxID=1353952 RepID=A0A165CS03_9BASI|nr:hypothetical protein CALCODRAFT_488038 [Calocera cornea HHB12733]